MKPVNVLMYMFFPGGGIGRYTHELAIELDRRDDVNFELACTSEYQFLAESGYRTWPNLMTISSKYSLLRRFRFLTAQLVSPHRAINHAKRTDIDVIHFSNINHLTFPIWKRWLARNPDIRVAATAHDVRRSKSILNKGWETRALRDFYESADALFIHSSQQKEDLLDFANVPVDSIYQVPMGLMPYAVATASQVQLRQKFNVPESRFVGLFFGNIRDDKNLDQLLVAMSLQTSNRMFLVIAGRAGGAGNKNDAFYRQRIEELGLMDDVLFLDRFIENEEIGDLFEICDFVPIAYRESFTSQSAVLNVAMNYEKPILSSPAPTVAETVRQFNVGVATDSDDGENLKIGIEQLQELIEANTQFEFSKYKEQNSWRVNAEIASNVYHQLTKNK